MSLSVAAKANIQYAIDLMVKESAEELPPDSTVIEYVGKASRDAGFVPTGQRTFEQAVRDNPISTLLSLTFFVGA
jgi:hypothetical protein